MNATPLMQSVLGADWDKLPKVIQQHYQLQPDQITHNLVAGTLFVDYPWFVTPILKIVRLFGGLIDMKGTNMPTRVEKWVNPDLPDSLFWRRKIKSQGGETTVFSSRMEFQKANEIIEHIGFGFGLNLKVNVENEQLIYRSNGHLWQLAKFRLPIPDVLFLGHATITEKATSAKQFELDFNILHPLLGETYRYGGVFELTKS